MTSPKIFWSNCLSRLATQATQSGEAIRATFTWNNSTNLFLRNWCFHDYGNEFGKNQKNPRVRKIFVRNSGVGNGCANCMGAWKNAFFLQAKPMSIKFLLLGVFGGGSWGGGSADFIFMGAGIFLTKKKLSSSSANFFGFGEGNLLGILAGILRIFPDPLNKGSKLSGKISEHFSWENSCASK